MNDRRSDAAAVDDVLKPAAIIDTFMTGNQLDASVQRDWQDLRRELEELARLYGVTWNRTGSRSNPPYVAAAPMPESSTIASGAPTSWIAAGATIPVGPPNRRPARCRPGSETVRISA